MKIAIVGAGFFGLTLGLILSKKHKIEIFEKKKSILNGFSLNIWTYGKDNIKIDNAKIKNANSILPEKEIFLNSFLFCLYQPI